MTFRRRSRALARTAVQRFAFVAIGALGLGTRLYTRRFGDRGAAAEQGERPRFLLVRLDLLGDVLFTLPLADGLRARYPGARIVMLTLPYTAALARLSPAVDRVIVVDTNRIRRARGLLNPATWGGYLRALRELRAERFDLAVSVYGQMASLWSALSGARRTLGYAREAYPFLLTEPVRGGRHRERKHEVDYVRALGPHMNVTLPDRPALRVAVDERARARSLLEDHGIAREDRIVVIHAGSINGSAKRWPAPHWSDFADRLQTGANVRVVLVGSEADAPLAATVAAGAATGAVSLAGKTDLPALAAVIARADLVASGDSGPLHLAAALGRPLLGVYGPTDPVVYGPYRPRAAARVHRADLPCSPCYTLAASAECPLGDPVCMRLVSVEAMTESALALLAGSENQLAMAQEDTLQDPE